MTARRLGTLTAVAVVALVVLGTGVAVGADGAGHTAQFEGENVSTTEVDDLTVVDFNWPGNCPDQGVSDLDEYFDGDIGSSNNEFHIDNAGGAAEQPPNEGCVLRTESEEGENPTITSIPGEQLQNINYYPQRGDTISWNHYVHNIDPVFGPYPGEFEFRFGVQDAANYYFLRVDADNSPLEFILGEASGGTLAAEDRVTIENELQAGVFQPVEITWGENDTIEAVFNGTKVVNIDSDSLDDGGIAFSREGVEGTVRSYAHMVDEVSADAASHLQIDSLAFPDVIAPDEELTVNYTLANTGEQPVTESEVGLYAGSGSKEDADTNVTVGPGGTASGTLTYDTNVTVAPGGTASGTLTYDTTGEYGEGDTFAFSVQTETWGDQQGGSVTVAEPAQLQVELTTPPPAEVNVENPLELDYEVENVGNRTASSFVQLSVDEETGFADFDDVTLDPGDTQGGTLVYDNVSASYSAGENISWEVGIAEHPDTVSGTTLVRNPPEFELSDVSAPEDVGIGAVFSLEYQVTNLGGESGTVTAVDLGIGPDQEIVDTDTNIELPPGVSKSGTLEFEGVGDEYDEGDTLEWSVVVTPSGDSASGETTVSDGPILEVSSVDAPDQMGINQDLVVEYTVQNYGDVRGVEDSVQLAVDGSLADYDTDVAVLPGGAATGTLVYDSVSTSFTPGDTVPFTVSLEKYGDNASSQTAISEADGPGELYFTVSPPNPKAGEELLLEAGHYDSSLYYYWLVDGEQVGTGTAATTVVGEPGEYNFTLIESEIPNYPFGDGAGTQFNETVTKTVSIAEGDVVVSDLEISGLHTPLFKELERQRPVEVTIDTTKEQEFESVELQIYNRTTSLYSGDTNGTTQTWRGNIRVGYLERNGSYSDTEMTIRVKSFGTNYTETRMLEVRDTPEWLGTALEYSEVFTPVERTQNGYELELDLFDTEVVIDSGTSPYWEEDLNVTLKGMGRFAITAQSIDLGGRVLGSTGIMGTQGTLSLAPTVSFGYNVSLLEAQLLTTAALEKDIFEQEFGLDPLYEQLPSIITSKLPSCKIGAGASVKGELKHNTRFVDGLNPFEDLETMGLQGQPTLKLNGEATCGPATVKLESDPTAKAAAKFALPTGGDEFELLGAGGKADIDLTGELEIDIWKIDGGVEETWDLYEWEVVDGEDPFLGGPMRGAPLDHLSTPSPERTGSGLVRQSAGAETEPLSGVPSVDEGAVTAGLSPTTATDTTVRITDRVFDDTQPTLAPVGEEYALLWSSEPASGGDTQPSNLKVRVGSGTDWGEPVSVTDNDDHEGEASLATGDDGSALAAWSQFPNADRDIGDIEGEFFQEYEIAVAAAADPAQESSWTTPTQLTGGDTYNFDPTVKQLGPDQWVVVWDRNTAANLSNLDAEEVGYALLSTVGDTVTVEKQGTIADARSPDIGVSDGEITLAFHRPGDGVTGGEVVRGTLDPAAGEFQPAGTHEVSSFTDLAVAADRVAWVDGTAENPSISMATAGASAAQKVSLSEETTRVSQLELTAQGDRTVLTYQADARGSETLERDLFVQANAGGTWSEELQLARADVDSGPVTLSAANPVATAEETVVPYAVTDASGNSSTDVFLVERPYEPTHALSADVQTPENVSVGDEVTVEATVENVAVATDGQPATVRVTDGETTVASTTVGPLDPGETGTVTLTPETPATGDIAVTVDGATPELDDGAFNQTVTETLVTSSLQPGEIEVTRIDETTSELAVTVENAAEAGSDPMSVALLDGEETLATAAVPAIAGGESQTVTTTFDPTELDRSSSETLMLDSDSDLAEGAVATRTTSVWAGQPDITLTGEVKYRQTTEGSLVASLVVGNEGALGTTTTVSAIDQTNNEVLGVAAVELPPAVEGSAEYTKVHVPLGAVSEGDTVMFDASAEAGTRPVASTGTTGLADTVGPVLTQFVPPTVAGSASPQDLSGDGLYRDVDGDGIFNTDDVAALFENLENSALQDNAWAYGFAGGELRQHVGVADVQALYEQANGGDVPGEPQPAGDVTVSLVPTDPDVGVGEETTVDVVVEGANAGIDAFGFTVSTSDVVTMTDVESTPRSPYTETSIGPDGDVLRLATAAGADGFEPGNHTVATLTASVDALGVASLEPVVEPFPSGVLAGPAQPYDVTTDGTTFSVGEGQFTVDIVETPDTVMGESADVVVNVTNLGTGAGAQTVTLDFESAIPGSTSTVETEIELGPGQSVEETLSVPTDADDSGIYDVTVATADDSDQATLEVHPPAIPGIGDRPRDLDTDGIYEDVNGDGDLDIFDVQSFFEGYQTDAVQDNHVAFHFDDDETVDIFDVQALFESV